MTQAISTSSSKTLIQLQRLFHRALPLPKTLMRQA